MGKFFELIWYRATAELRAEAARAYLGIIWWIAEPVLYMAAFYLGFDTGLKRGGSAQMAFLLCGLVPWKWFATTVQHGSKAIINNGGLMHQVYIPKFVLPGIVMVANSIKFLIIFVLFLVFIVAIGKPVVLPWLGIIPVILVQFLLVGAFCTLFGALVPFMPDLQLVIDNGIIVLMFLSGVFIDISRYSPAKRHIFELNPMAVLLQQYRTVLLDGHWPDWGNLGTVMAISVVLYAAGLVVLIKFDRVYPKVTIS
ncbi:MAG: ABC transporter permease [Rhodothermales bacterium]